MCYSTGRDRANPVSFRTLSVSEECRRMRKFIAAHAVVRDVRVCPGERRPMRRTALFQGRDLFALQLATDPQIRPDGREIAYVRISFDIMTDRGRQSIWLIDAESGEQRPLVTGAGSHSQPRWSPNGGSHRVRLDGRRRPAAAVRALDADRTDREDRRSHRSAGQPAAGRPTASGSRSRCSRPTRRRGSAKRRRSPKARSGRRRSS